MTEVATKNWYIVHTYSGFEKKVAESLEQRVQAYGLQNEIGEILIPTEDVVERRSGRKVVTPKRFFPGYILVEMTMSDHAWHVVKNTPKVTGFVGAGSKPTPLSKEEVEQILDQVKTAAEKPKPKYSFEPRRRFVMAKKVQAMVKLQIPAGKATPAPPVGTALGPHGVNIMDFCKNFNAKTAKDDGLIIPVLVTVYADRTYSFITKTPPASVLLKKVANLAKGSAEPNRNKVGTVTAKQVEDIAKTKMPDLNCDSLESAVKTVRGTARSMGIDVIG